MKLSTLKFKQITSLINNRDLTLEMFGAQQQLFEKDQKGSTPRSRNRDGFERTMRPPPRPGTGRERATYFNYQYCSASKQKNQRQVEDCFYYLQKSLVDYIELISSEERKCIRKEMEGLVALLRSFSPQELLVKLQQLQGVLSKRFSNRLMHLTFYLVFNKLSSLHCQRNLEREIKHYIFCEYYSRKFNFKQLTLAVCIEIQSLYCIIKNYQESRAYARKCLKLAVVLGDDYHEGKMIENLSILNYYEGRLNQESGGLGKDERKRILESYSEEKELPDIFKLEEREGEEEFTQFSVERHNNFIENSVQSKNVKYFQSNYHEIVKTIPKKNINVRNIIAKVGEVGLVRKYFSKDNFITIRPECHIIRATHQEQILITHKRSQPQAHSKSHLPQKLIRRLLTLFQDTISCYAYTL